MDRDRDVIGVIVKKVDGIPIGGREFLKLYEDFLAWL